MSATGSVFCGGVGLNLKDVEMFLSMFTEKIILAWKDVTTFSERSGTQPLTLHFNHLVWSQQGHRGSSANQWSHGRASANSHGGESSKTTNIIPSFEKQIQPLKIHTANEFLEICLVRLLLWSTFWQRCPAIPLHDPNYSKTQRPESSRILGNFGLITSVISSEIPCLAPGAIQNHLWNPCNSSVVFSGLAPTYTSD